MKVMITRAVFIVPCKVVGVTSVVSIELVVVVLRNDGGVTLSLGLKTWLAKG